jgi:hypothetical protein
MGQEYARIGRNRIMQIHSWRPQPVIKLISYKLEGIGSTGWPAFITLNYDPFQYQTTERHQQLEEISLEMRTKRDRLAVESRNMEIRQTVIDVWDKAIIQQRRVTYDLAGIKVEIATSVASNLRDMIRGAVKDLKSDLAVYARVLVWVLFSLAYILFRLTAS